jgi:hypothetical protein
MAQEKHKTLAAKASKLRGAVSSTTSDLRSAEAAAERLRAKLAQIEIDLLATEEAESEALAVVKKLTNEKCPGNSHPADEAEQLRVQAVQAKVAMETASQHLAELQLRVAAALEAANLTKQCAEDTDRRLQTASAAAQGEAEARRIARDADLIVGHGAEPARGRSRSPRPPPSTAAAAGGEQLQV